MPIRRLMAVAMIAAGAVAAWQAVGIRVDNRLERWLGKSGPDAATYESFRRLFGSDEFLLAVVGGGSFFEPATLDMLLSAAEELEQVPEVVEVRGIPVVYRDLFGAEDPEALAEEMTSTPFYRGLFISEDGERAGLLIEVEPSDDAAARERLVTATEAALAPVEAAGRELYLVGSPALIAALDEVSSREARRTLPIALLGSLLMLALMLRSARAMVVTATSALLSVVLAVGIAAVSGVTLNMVTTALPPLLWVLALSNSIHIMRRYQALRRERDLDEALAMALAQTTRPCSLAAITTAAGFASLAAAVMEPVRELGWLAAVGILLSLAVNLTVTPFLVQLLRVPAFRRDERAATGWWLRIWRGSHRAVLAVAATVTVAALATIPWIEVESNPLAFLPTEHPTTEDFRSIDDRLGGFYTLEVLVETPDVWYAPEVWPVLESIGARIESSPIITRVLSPVDVLAKLHQWQEGLDPRAYRPPGARAEARQLVASAGETGRRALDRLVANEGRTVRLSALVAEMNQQRFLDLVGAARSVVEELPSGWQGRLTGQVLLLVDAQQRLVTSQLRSLALAFCLIFAVLAVGLGALRLLAVAAAPNLLPVVSAFAAMAVLGLPLDAGTVMVASIALGIAVDNTVHVLANVRRRQQAGAATSEAVASTLNDIGPALAATTATACVGFLALASSEFVPIRDFGLLATVAMVAALVADVVVLPALLVLTGERS